MSRDTLISTDKCRPASFVAMMLDIYMIANAQPRWALHPGKRQHNALPLFALVHAGGASQSRRQDCGHGHAGGGARCRGAGQRQGRWGGFQGGRRWVFGHAIDHVVPDPMIDENRWWLSAEEMVAWPLAPWNMMNICAIDAPCFTEQQRRS
eukprot:scaffold173599_cov19-Tisochrysis_lutea.AAC.2